MRRGPATDVRCQLLASIPCRSAAVAFHAGSLLRDLDAYAGANAGSAGLDHLARVVQTFDAARSFNAQLGTDSAAHQGNIRHSGPAFGKASRCFDEISAGLFS